MHRVWIDTNNRLNTTTTTTKVKKNENDNGKYVQVKLNEPNVHEVKWWNKGKTSNFTVSFHYTHTHTPSKFEYIQSHKSQDKLQLHW